MRFLILSVLLILLTGCAGDQKGHQAITVAAPPPIPQFDPSAAKREDVARLSGAVDQVRSDIATSSNATQAQMTGAVNLSLGKIAERFTGVEANIDSLAKIQMTNTANLNARMDTTANVITQMKADIKTDIALSAKLDVVIESNVQLKVQIEAMNTANANGQVGLENKITSMISNSKTDAAAGHDVNMLPKEAVDLVTSSLKEQLASTKSNNNTWLAIITGLFSAVSGVATIMAYSARKEKEGTQQLLQIALTHVPPEKAKEFMPQPHS